VKYFTILKIWKCARHNVAPRTFREHRVVTDARVAKHGRRLVKTTGDGCAAWVSVVDAVEGVVAVQAVMAERNEGVPEDRRMLCWIAVNLDGASFELDERHRHALFMPVAQTERSSDGLAVHGA